MSANFGLRIDTQGTLERLQRQMAAMPSGVERARRRALHIAEQARVFEFALRAMK